MTTANAQAGASTDTKTRVVTVITTRGQKTKFEFSGSKWEHLEKMLSKGGTDIKGKSFNSYDLRNMKCVEGATKHTLEHPDAKLPEGDFNLFIMPVQSKSGAKELSRSEVYTRIKKHIEKDGDKAKEHFTVKGKNYTKVPTDKLVELLESYKPGTKAKAKATKNEALNDVADSILECETEEEVEEHLEGLTLAEKVGVLVKTVIKLKKNTGVANVVGSLANKDADKPKEKTPEELKAEEEEKADSEETDELMKEMNAMSSGFKDVKR